MRALVVKNPGPPGALQLTEEDAPSPGPGELTVDVAYAGVGFVDTLFRSGAFDFPTPFTPGIEVTGHVRETGPGVTGFEPGQPVSALLNDFGRGMRAGGYAEVAVAHATMTTRLPADADLARMAAVLVNGVTAWLALHDLARLRVSDDVLVLGASGGLGSITGRMAAAHPARRVIGSSRRPSDDPTWTHLVPDLDTVRLVVVGNASGQDDPVSADSAWLNSRQIIGLSLGGVAHLVPDRVEAALSAVVELVHREVLREPDPSVVPLDQAAEVHHALDTRTAPPKTVLDLR